MVGANIEWRVSPGLTEYPAALAEMESRVAAIHAGDAHELVWLLEHPPLYTAGTSAASAELLTPERFPIYEAGRGGRYTYHGPGQRVVYILLDLTKRGRDVRGFVHALEGWVIDTLARVDIDAHRAPGRIGIWTGAGRDEAKIAAIGVRVRRWISFHGLAINVDPALEHFEGIVPCGIAEYPVTSVAAMGKPASMTDIDAALRAEFGGFLSALAPLEEKT